MAEVDTTDEVTADWIPSVVVEAEGSATFFLRPLFLGGIREHLSIGVTHEKGNTGQKEGAREKRLISIERCQFMHKSECATHTHMNPPQSIRSTRLPAR